MCGFYLKDRNENTEIRQYYWVQCFICRQRRGGRESRRRTRRDRNAEGV